MRKTLIFFVLLTVAGASFADNLSIISGKWNKKNKSAVKLYRVDYGALIEMASSQVTADNAFSFAFYPEREAFYVIGHNSENAINNYTFYFKPGDRLNVTVNEDGSYMLTGNNTPENKELARWHDFITPLEQKSIYFMGSNSTYVDFFPLLEEKLAAMPSFRVEYTKNKEFSKAFGVLREYDILFLGMHYLRVPRSAHPQGEDFPDWYRSISVEKIASSGQLMSYPYGRQLLSCYPFLMSMLRNASEGGGNKPTSDPLRMFDVVIAGTTDVVVQGEAALLATRYLKSYEGYLSFEEEYGKYITTDNQKQRLNAVMIKLTEKSEGQTAVNFKFPDTTGKEVALTDFKGKVVYIDVWATWCGPCKEQIPYLKKLEEEYSGKDVVFMSISIDDQKSHDKWLKFIDDNQLKGVQLFAGNKKDDISKPYKIAGIPRFILVGKDGKLISSDAPRPFSPEIKLALDAALKKK